MDIMNNTYAKLIDEKLVLFRNPLQKDGMDIYNPSAEVLAGEGYKPYTEEDVDSSRLDVCDLGFEYQETDTEIRKVWIYTPNLEKAKSAKLSEINAACDEILNTAVNTYPQTEVLTFDQQATEADKYLSTGNEADAPLLAALAAGRGIALGELVQRVKAKTTAFTALSGSIIGQRQALEDRLDACETVEEVQLISVDFNLPEMVNAEAS